MIVVYDQRQRPQFLADVRRKHDADHVVARNPRYIRSEDDYEAKARLVYLCQPHALIEEMYARHGIPVILGTSIDWDDQTEAEAAAILPGPPKPELSEGASQAEVPAEGDSEESDSEERDPEEDEDDEESSASGWRLRRAGSGWYRVVNAEGEDVVDHAVRYEEGRQIIREASSWATVLSFSS